MIGATRAPTYHDNDKVKPTPGIGEVFGKAKGKPFDEHLKEKYDSEELIDIAKIIHKPLVFLEVDVFQSLWVYQKS